MSDDDVVVRLFPRGGRASVGRRSRSGQPRANEDNTRTSAGDTFREEPAPLAEFVTDQRFLGSPPLSLVQFEAVRHLEQVLLPATYGDMVEAFGPQWAPVRSVNFVVLQWAKGAGKDYVCRVAVARVAHLLMCLKDARAYYGMPRHDAIHILNVAPSEAQARRIFFEPLQRMITGSPWFADRFQVRSGSIQFEQGVELISGHSAAQTQEGLNLLVGIADEISAFRTDDETAHLVKTSGREPGGTASGIFRMLTTSARTRFPGTFKVAAISYPRFKGDAIQALTDEGRDDMERSGERSAWFVSGPLATWEVNPRIESKEVFKDDYDRDPAMARAMYECRPDVRLNRMFRNEQAVRAAFNRDIAERVTVEYSFGRISPGDRSPAEKTERGWVAHLHFDSALRPIPGALYVVHGDLSLRRNRAGFAMAHVVDYDPLPAPEGSADLAPIVRVDLVGSFEADLEAEPAPREIRISWFRELLRELQRLGFILARVTLDGYQSADTIQIVRGWGIDSGVVSTDRSSRAWETLRDVMYAGRLEAYGRPRVVKELLELVVLPGGKVRAPAGGSKDEADALACAVLGAVDMGGREAPEGETSSGNDFSVGPGPFPMLDGQAWGVRKFEDLGPGPWPEWDTNW